MSGQDARSGEIGSRDRPVCDTDQGSHSQAASVSRLIGLAENNPAGAARGEEHARMRALPTGTVTFLFSDIEGSTRLLQWVGGERYAGLLTQHQALLRAAWAAH